MESKVRSVCFYRHYFEEFFERQNKKVKKKILWTLKLIEEVQMVPETYLKHLSETEGLYEIRVQQGSDIFRIFCFFDEGKLVVAINGFQKKTQKTPYLELTLAITIKKEYYEEKRHAQES